MGKALLFRVETRVVVDVLLFHLRFVVVSWVESDNLFLSVLVEKDDLSADLLDQPRAAVS